MCLKPFILVGVWNFGSLTGFKKISIFCLNHLFAPANQSKLQVPSRMKINCNLEFRSFSQLGWKDRYVMLLAIIDVPGANVG